MRNKELLVQTINRSPIEHSLVYMVQLLFDCYEGDVYAVLVTFYKLPDKLAETLLNYYSLMCEVGFVGVSCDIWNELLSYKSTLDTVAGNLGAKLNWARTNHYFD